MALRPNSDRPRTRAHLATGGVVGSITHCQGYCAAVVAPLTQFVSIGIDAEQNLPLPTGVLDVISTTEESLTIPNLLDCGVNWDRLLFCAKESVFKAWYSITKQWLDFHECTIEWGKTEHIAPLERGCTVGKFIAELSRNYWLGNAAFRSFEGRFVFDRNHLATLVVVNQPFSQQF
jgi:4'-phosphopantetheinyl transferase EntD